MQGAVWAARLEGIDVLSDLEGLRTGAFKIKFGKSIYFNFNFAVLNF
jgi:hypothetical protein